MNLSQPPRRDCAAGAADSQSIFHGMIPKLHLGITLKGMLNMEAKGLLDGIVVLDLGRVLACPYAAAMLGEKELRKWLITAVAGQLYTDKPNELTRMSLLRAKFAENLAPVFSMAIQSSELFLMGLFSVLDVILDMPMKDALETIKVSKNISDALVYHKGIFAFPLEFILQYENANWQEVSRLMIVHNIEMQPVYDAYLNALRWYRDTIFADTDSQTAEEKPEE